MIYDYGPSLLPRLEEITARWLDEERALEATWTEPSTNDRITAAFKQLNARGILACECLGSTIHDGWGYAASEASATHRGVAFFHGVHP
ncbi:DUF6891 domain-containing protein [Hyalangium gracile]|uniref:DUF6891 domain-containing protein n=1 Tax=Hyalangium gracile TaxID=394092 RepID=UPI001CCF9907|nr:hypothetical protein [Hyalangium gracile]